MDCRSGNYSCHCYARTDGVWHPTPEAKVDSGQCGAQPFHCTSHDDCQLNGACVAGACRCDAAWTGDRCQRLNLLAANPLAGLQDPVLSSWGGSVLQDPTTQLYHMFAAVIEHGCGLAAWRPNSALGHATSSTPDGPYTLERLIKPHFAHEPVAVWADPNHTEVLIYHIGAGDNATGPGSNYASNCSGRCTGADHRWIGGGSFTGPTAVLVGPTLNGPWKSVDIGYPSTLPGCPRCGDSNPAPVLLQDGRVDMMWRTTSLPTCPGQSCMARATAPTWEGPYTWNISNLFGGQTAARVHVEDAHVWTAPATAANPGSFHALFHSDAEGDGSGSGGHAWSADGAEWTFSGYNAYTSTVVLQNGSSVKLQKRERPHLVLDSSGTPIALTNGAGWPGDCDHVFTFVQPIRTAKEAEETNP